MEKSYDFWIRFNLFLFLLTLVGFGFTYLKFAPHFDGFPWFVHIHFSAFFLWFTVLVLQPYLIKAGRRGLHRTLGKFSYGLMFVLILTILIMVRWQVQEKWDSSQEAASLGAFVGILDAISLVVYFSIAMWNWRNVRWHVAFILACSLVIFNPGLARVCNAVVPGSGLPAAVLLPFLVAGGILIYEKRRKGRKVRSSPYFLFLVFWSIEIVLLLTVAGSAGWRQLVERMFII
jgi:hypothetical protein